MKDELPALLGVPLFLSTSGKICGYIKMEYPFILW
jgi:hypothetical protein